MVYFLKKILFLDSYVSSVPAAQILLQHNALWGIDRLPEKYLSQNWNPPLLKFFITTLSPDIFYPLLPSPRVF